MMEVLNALLEQAEQSGMLSLLPSDLIKFRASIYVDDLVIYSMPYASRLLLHQGDLGAFRGCVRTTDQSGQMLDLFDPMHGGFHCRNSGDFPCTLSLFPCKYLGAPLSVTSLKRSEEQRLVDAATAKITTWKVNMLNMAGRQRNMGALASLT
jgi:hypothetical protein